MNLESSKRKTVIYKGVSIRLLADFSTEAMQVRREWQEIFKIMKSKNPQPRLLYPAKLSFRHQTRIIWNAKRYSLRRGRGRERKR